ncbi:MAG TPA: carbon-nitrogen hydrolase family protein [Nanoarchaeota archaeon]|nr:carbon-nitrogen hydrolase family protein [Nanoarchaeota archaeon]
MKVTIAQAPVTASMKDNLGAVLKLVESNAGTDLIIFPECVLSTYEPQDKDYIKNIDFAQLSKSHEACREMAVLHKTSIIIGSIDKVNEKYYNTAFIFHANGTIEKYHKANLAFLDKSFFSAGGSLPVFEIAGVKVGIQICREIMYPEQWRLLAIKGAQLLVHITDCIEKDKYSLWKSYLVSRAAENQRYVFSVNNAHKTQGSPTIAIDPDGKILEEIHSEKAESRQIELDMSKPRDYYLNQRRTDLVQITGTN